MYVHSSLITFLDHSSLITFSLQVGAQILTLYLFARWKQGKTPMNRCSMLTFWFLYELNPLPVHIEITLFASSTEQGIWSPKRETNPHGGAHGCFSRCSSRGHNIERLAVAHTELELALERSARMPITDVSLLRRRKLLKRAFKECGDRWSLRWTSLRSTKQHHTLSSVNGLQRWVNHSYPPVFLGFTKTAAQAARLGVRMLNSAMHVLQPHRQATSWRQKTL
jgi:hypothetical protein